MQRPDKAAARSGVLPGGPVRRGGPNLMLSARASLAPPRVTQRFVVAGAVLALLAVTGIVLFTALRPPLKDDGAWLLSVAEKWLAGQRLYIDLVEITPPLIIWLSAVPAAIADWADLAPKSIAL